MAVLVLLLAVGAAALFAGSETRLASGTTIAGVDVGGLERADATALLTERSKAVEHTPVIFVAGGEQFRFTASQLGVRSDWSAAVAEAARATAGLRPVRGVRRLRTKLFGVDIEPHTSAYPSAVRFAVERIAGVVDRPAVDARLRRKGLAAAVVPGRPGIRLDRTAASAAIVTALSSLERGAAVRLSIARAEPTTTAGELVAAQEAFRAATSAPVTLDVAGRRATLSAVRIARLLELPSGGATRVAFAGPAASRWLAGLAKQVDRAPADATFAVRSGGIDVVPARLGRKLDLEASRRAVERAVLSPAGRRAELVVATARPARPRGKARAMGITASSAPTRRPTAARRDAQQRPARRRADRRRPRRTGSALLVQRHDRRAERAKGFQEAPVIINGELQNRLGGGSARSRRRCSTRPSRPASRSAAHEPRALHLPLSARARCDRQLPGHRPEVHQRHGQLAALRTFVGAGSLTVNLYGTPLNRRVETTTAPLEVEGRCRGRGSTTRRS